MNATNAALLGTLVGAGVALAGSLLTNIVLWLTERSRQRAAKYAADVETVRRHAAVAFSELFALNHAISWITWFATHDAGTVNQQMRASFDAETHSTFPKLLAAMAMVAGVDPDVYSKLLALQTEVFELWEKVASALHPHIATEELSGYLQRAEQLDSKLPRELLQMMEKRKSALAPPQYRPCAKPGPLAQALGRRGYQGGPFGVAFGER